MHNGPKVVDQNTWRRERQSLPGQSLNPTRQYVQKKTSACMVTITVKRLET